MWPWTDRLFERAGMQQEFLADPARRFRILRADRRGRIDAAVDETVAFGLDLPFGRAQGRDMGGKLFDETGGDGVDGFGHVEAVGGERRDAAIGKPDPRDRLAVGVVVEEA